MRKLVPVPHDALDVWPYIDALAPEELGRYSIEGNDVARIMRGKDDRYDHVIVPTTTPNVVLVVVVDLATQTVLGHHVIYLNDVYGVPA